MKLHVLKCPECHGELEIESGMKSCCCKYCGSQIHLDNEKYEETITHNINISHTERYIDEAAIMREEYRDKQDKRHVKIGIVIGGGIPLLLLLGLILYFVVGGNVAKSQGKISAGYYKDLVGQDYQTVVAHFESAGFEDIQVIDLDDSGLAFWNDGKVEMISVAGKTDFESVHWFDPDAKVVISYH